MTINDKFITAFVVDLDGNIFSTSANGFIPNLNVKNQKREYYTAIIEDEKKFNITNPFYSDVLNGNVITVSVPIYRNDRLIGIFGGTLNFEGVIPKTHINFRITNNDGVIMASSELNASLLGKNIYSINPTYKSLTLDPILRENNENNENNGHYSISKQSINGGVILFSIVNQDVSVSMSERLFYGMVWYLFCF